MLDAPSRYTRTAVALHWIIFVTVLGGWALGQYMSGLPFSPQKLRYVSWHKWIGVSAFLFTVLRLTWRAYRAPPPLPVTMSAAQRFAAHIVHGTLYVLVLAIPIT